MFGGALLDRAWSLPVGGGSVTVAAGSILIAVFIVVMLIAFGAFRRRRTSIIPVRPTTALVTSGVYGLTRNPMYVGMALLTAGVGLMMNSWWPMVLLVPTLLIVRRFVIAREERYLQRKFGSEYEAYMARVRRWL